MQGARQADEARQALLKRLVHARMPADVTRRACADPEFLERAANGVRQCGVVRQSQVVVAAERQVDRAVDLETRALRAFDPAPAPDQAGLIELAQTLPKLSASHQTRLRPSGFGGQARVRPSGFGGQARVRPLGFGGLASALSGPGANQQHMRRRDARHRLCDTAHQQVVDAAASVRSKHDQVRLPATGLVGQHHGHTIVNRVVADDRGLGLHAVLPCDCASAFERRLPGLAQRVENGFQIDRNRAGRREGEARLLDHVNDSQLRMLIDGEPRRLLDRQFRSFAAVGRGQDPRVHGRVSCLGSAFEPRPITYTAFLNARPTMMTPDSRAQGSVPANESGRLHEVLVVGGGAGGLELVTRLGDRLGRRRRARVTLIEKTRAHFWKPHLHEIAAGSMDLGSYETNYLAQSYWHGFRYLIGEMTGLDRARRLVQVAPFVDEDGDQVTPARAFGYDTLVIAVGSLTHDFGVPGVAQHAFRIDTPSEAERFHRRLVNAFIRAHAQTTALRPGQLQVALIGAGATGVELAAELHRTTRTLVSYGLDRIDPDKDIRLILLEASPRILPALPERLAKAAMRLLEQLGVRVRTSSRVQEVLPNGVRLASGEEMQAELVVWAAGVKAPDFLRNLGLETNRINQIVVHQIGRASCR